MSTKENDIVCEDLTVDYREKHPDSYHACTIDCYDGVHMFACEDCDDTGTVVFWKSEDNKVESKCTNCLPTPEPEQ